VCGVALLAALAGAMAAAEPPSTVNIHGQLIDNQGHAITGVRDYLVRFFDAPGGGAQLGGDLTGTVGLSAEGLFDIAVDLPAEVLASTQAWYELAVDSDGAPNGVDANDVFPERVKVESVPFALQAASVEHVDAPSISGGGVENAEFDTLDGVTAPIQDQLDLKANAADVYTKVEVDLSQGAQDTLIALKANSADVYTRTVADDLFVDVTGDTMTGALVVNGSFVEIGQAAAPSPVTDRLYNVAGGLLWNGARVDDGLPRTGAAYIIVTTTDDATANGANLLAAYAAAAALTPHGSPLSATNRAVVLLPPGRYDLGAGQLVMDEEYVDLVGLSTARENQHIHGSSNGPGTGVLRQTADDVRIENLSVECTQSTGTLFYSPDDPAAYFPDADRSNTRIRNVAFLADDAHAWTMRLGKWKIGDSSLFSLLLPPPFWPADRQRTNPAAH